MRKRVLHEQEWFWFCHRLASDREAKLAFDRLNAEAEKQGGKLDIGVYRHGLDYDKAEFITVVSVRKKGVRFAEEFIGGDDFELDERLVDRLILRRARKVLEFEKAGHYRVGHPEGGSHIDETGRSHNA